MMLVNVDLSNLFWFDIYLNLPLAGQCMDEYFNNILHFPTISVLEPLTKFTEIDLFFNQLNGPTILSELDNIKTIYHYSIPNTKLYYPEPYLAAASFMHTDLWFVHILIYQYWLWFVFIFMIVFFFLTFICIIRWCNMRVRPRRETRGVSRSKCGDLITACVPISWAISIIVNESADAIDYYDGFGTSELVVGIRAYQWGWEYYYPKDVDLNYRLKNNHSLLIGNSLKYDTMGDLSLKTNKLWKYFQQKTGDAVITPAHLLLAPIDNYKLMNFNNFNDIGADSLVEANAFHNVQMLSKTFNSNLITLPLTNTTQYDFVQKYTHNDFIYTKSYSYGLYRQHNLLTTQTLLNNFNTFFDLNSLNQYIQYSTASSTSTISNNPLTGIYNFYYSNLQLDGGTISANLGRIFELLLPTPTAANTAGIYLTYPTYMLLWTDYLNTKYADGGLIANLVVSPATKHLFTLATIYDFTNGGAEEAEMGRVAMNCYRTINKISSNFTYSAKERSLRHLLNLKPTAHLLNYTNAGAANITNLYRNYVGAVAGQPDLNMVGRFLTNRLFFSTPYAPIRSTHPLMGMLDFDTSQNALVEDFPMLLQSKEDLTANFVFTAYWDFGMANTTSDWNYFFVNKMGLLNQIFYLPVATWFYDYDFRNLQSLELIEDIMWEAIYPSGNYEEYLTIHDGFNTGIFFDKYESFFNTTNRLMRASAAPLFKTFFVETGGTASTYPLAVYFPEAAAATTLVTTSNYFLPIWTTIMGGGLEDSYENFKFLTTIGIQNNCYLVPIGLIHPHPHTTSTLFNWFRSDYDDMTWYYDMWTGPSNQINWLAGAQGLTCGSSLFDLRWVQGGWNLTIKKVVGGAEFADWTCNIDWLASITTPPMEACIYGSYPLLELMARIQTGSRGSAAAHQPLLVLRWDVLKNYKFGSGGLYPHRLTNPIVHISTVKNAIVTHNAMQKVFRSRFDEGRSHAKLLEVANFEANLPFITGPIPAYESLLGKNTETFFDINWYQVKFFNMDMTHHLFTNLLNYYYYDFPFLLAYKSDASRHMWFDWYARWNFIEVQPASQSRYALYGMPYFSKLFEFNTNMGDLYNESENYFSRLSRARQNYLPAWTYTPYFYARANTWYADNLLVNLIQSFNNPLIRVQYLLMLMDWYWNQLLFNTLNNYLFFSGHSMLTTYGKAGWRPIESVQSYYFNITLLIDILVKREYLYRQLFESYNKITNLPLFLTATPRHPLIEELKALYLFVDPLIDNNWSARGFNDIAASPHHPLLLQPFLNQLFGTFNFNFFWNYVVFYLTNIANHPRYWVETGPALELQKNQYRPLRKGISNMIRIHATGAIALPTEVRIQILASSKDVIHSWAIPSAGIKLDCVPGYSSHKIFLFLLSGIFWGQCMEICGRYHHWMPIVIYFMKRDLFFLWCLHFVFLNSSSQELESMDRQYANHLHIVSFDKLTWLAELNNLE